MSTQRPRIGWTTDPADGTVGMAHATYPGQTTSLCGADTPFLGDPWPLAGQEWPSTYCRCPSCALRLDTKRPRWLHKHHFPSR
ncbi:hypothetical protein V3G39_09375 [Dermatophilaceae bacterium Sec6.4]